MAKVKYYYDPETLSYKKIKVKPIDKIKTALAVLVAGLILMIWGYLIITPFVYSPKEKHYKREIDNYAIHMELIQKRLTEYEKRMDEIAERDNNIYRQYLEANPIPREQRKAGFGGVNRYKNLQGFENSDQIEAVTKSLDNLANQIYVQSKSLDEIVKLAEDKENMLASIPAIQPVKNEDLKRMASGFGMRMHPILKYRKMHNGMDFTANKGTPIYATGNGTVVKAKRSSTFGNHVIIDHGYGFKTIYAHMSKMNTKKGKKILRGDVIGYVGNTGRSAAPHLHYEVHKNGKPVNPVYYYYGDLTPEEFEKMLDASHEEGQSLD
ncbi:M23 family metallopeptidase [Aureivirga sp. CE67]|uniref:M23 family metallopeptidase n=1 Tax=Aureivirga sp. CE67 TaxID=1788983 RepID=UPI0018CB94DC|nr:M23 family metallopeptidase [Aureivirga sp. CE67]